jgi:tetratricopeptide (TPR) repeat protein
VEAPVSDQTAFTASERGVALLDLRRPQEAAEHFRAAIAAEPDWPEPRCQLALALLGMGEPEEALEAAASAISLDPENEWPHRIRALALSALDRDAEAVEAAETAVELEPENPLGHEVLADARHAAGDRRGAREAAETSRELGPERAGPHVTLGDIALEDDAYGEAEAHYRAALALDPEHSHALNNLGVVLLRSGRKDEAREVFEQVARLDPHADHARENLATSARGYVNGVLMFVVAYIAFRAIVEAFRDDNPALGLVAGAAAVALFGVAWWRRSRRMATLSPGARQLLDDQPWHEKLQIKRWRPWFWLVPSTIWFAIGVLVLIGFVVAGATGGAGRWELGDWLVIAAIAAFTALCGRYARIRLRRRGRWPF